MLLFHIVWLVGIAITIHVPEWNASVIYQAEVQKNSIINTAGMQRCCFCCSIVVALYYVCIVWLAGIFNQHAPQEG